MKKTTLSVIIPTYNEAGNIEYLIERIEKALLTHRVEYEIIVVDDHSTDATQRIVTQHAKSYPLPYTLRLYVKKGKKGKAQSLIEGFSYARYALICMIDADVQYPPEAIPAMLKKILDGVDVVVANRKEKNVSWVRRMISHACAAFVGRFLHNFSCDVQSGLKVFKREIVERIQLNPSSWAFDLEFLVKARDAGYRITNHEITFAKRLNGSSKISFFSATGQIFFSALKLKVLRHDIIPFLPEVAKKKGNGFHYKGKEFIHHSQLHHSQTAFYRLSGMQIVILFGILAITAQWLWLDWHTTLVVLIAGLTLLYFADLLFNLYLVYRTFTKSAEIKISDKEIEKIPDEKWPHYTVLCPLYKEWQVLPQFINAMSRLDYPKDRLQVMLLLEENDLETINHIKNYALPGYFQIVVVPHSMPKTKPKACNYGLTKATGDYTVIYDAEDVPDPKQLKKAILAFSRSDKKTICIQAKLNFYNPHQNLLTRAFTMEYSLWFDLVLTGLQSIHAPIPLGGTSNHFRTVDLHKLKGWDSFNVTEDCDLGMRLVKQGYETAVIDSTTLEEANSSIRNWFWQRTRWIKGYMQTYLLHMRSPLEFVKNWRQPHVITFQLVVGGKVMSMFINPLMWVITICYFLFRIHIATFIESFFPTPVLYMGVFSLLVGNFLYMYYYMIGCAKQGHHELVKYVVLVPFYWLVMSIAAWIAFYKLLTAPHHWSKTKHGLHLNSKKAVTQASVLLGHSLTDQTIQANKNHIPSVSICIPAFNEENNIANLLGQILRQEQQGFAIEEIIVNSDGSTDNTVDIVGQYQDRGVKVIDNKYNKGLSYRENEIISKTTSDILVLLNADILLGNNHALYNLIAPVLNGADLSAQYARPITPRTFLERILHAGFELKYFVYTHHKKGNNIYTCVGHMRALSRRFYSHIVFPKSSEGEDQYLYLACVNGGYRYEHAKAVTAYFKLPDNFRDYKTYAKRIFQTQKKYGDVFSEKLARSERKIPLWLTISGCVYAFAKKPLYVFLYVMLHIMVQQWALKQPVNSAQAYEISKSTKFLIQNLSTQYE